MSMTFTTPPCMECGEASQLELDEAKVEVAGAGVPF